MQVALHLWLRNLGAVKDDTAMPNSRLSKSEIEAILAHLNQVDAVQ